MSFMRGPAPWRRSLEYLKQGQLVLKDKVKIFSVNYHEQLPESDGLRRFIFWHLAQVQYKNPKVQCIQFKNVTNSPFITFYTLDNMNKQEKVLVNCYKRSQGEIMDWCVKIMGKTKEELALAAAVNPANFNQKCGRYCMCQVSGQVSCPQFKPLPLHLRGKYRFVKKDELAEFRQKTTDEQAMKDYWGSV